jgi:hypothetical protein
MTINTNVGGWVRLFFYGAGAVHLWRSALSPKEDAPRGRSDRSIRIVGATLLSVIFIYFLGYGLGLYGMKPK